MQCAWASTLFAVGFPCHCLYLDGREWLVDCAEDDGEDPDCSNSEINYSTAEHTEYLGFHGGFC